MNKSVFHITNKTRNCLGTGFVIDKNDKGIFVATCGHVVNDCKEGLLVDGNESEVIENKYDDGLDLAILFVAGMDNQPFDIMVNNAIERVNVIGYSKFKDGDKKREAINDIRIKLDIDVSTERKIKNITTMKLYPNEDISEGYSGSPVVCCVTNQVVGVVNLKVVKDNINYAICSKHLMDIYQVDKADFTKDDGTEFLSNPEFNEEDILFLNKKVVNDFEVSLNYFSTQKTIWLEPELHSTPEESSDSHSDEITNVSNIVNNPRSLLIKSRQQYGLSSLSRFLIKEAWLKPVPTLWIYIDASKVKPYTQEIEKLVLTKLENTSLLIKDIKCIVLDEFSNSLENGSKVLNTISEFFNEIPIIVMMSQTENSFVDQAIKTPDDRKLEILHLWSLPRSGIRKIIKKYNNNCFIGDENTVVNKVASDLDVLNIPRTAFNILTLLKISEEKFDESPVNRTEMLGRVLSLLFNVDEIPKYKTRPDMKDTEYVLGFFCESILRTGKQNFARDDFIRTLSTFCEENETDLEVDVIFDILLLNNIVVQREESYCFKFSFWVFYFAAHRMHQSEEFLNYILSDKIYFSYPELIEFYTGIDRRRENAIKCLIKDIASTRDNVVRKCSLPSEFNIYEEMQWEPSKERLELMQNEITDGVLNSNFPDSVKDEYADVPYNRTKALNQTITTILEEYSVQLLMKGLEAGSKALRNSDYTNPKLRHELLSEILLSWEQLTNVLLALSPILAKTGYAKVEGASFVLTGFFGESPEEKFIRILPIIPTNVVGWNKDNIFSNKMSPLIIKHIEGEQDPLKRHFLHLLLITKRPKGWGKCIEDYIFSENKNSFYLFDIDCSLRAEFEYSFAPPTAVAEMQRLIKMVSAKHNYGVKKPKQKAIGKILDSILPTRNVKPY